MTSYTISEITELVEQNRAILIDLRESGEAHEPLPGAVPIPSHELLGQLAALEKYPVIGLYCADGLRSSIMARVLAKRLPHTIVRVVQ